MSPIIKTLYINFLTSGPDRHMKIQDLYDSCKTYGFYEEVVKLYRGYRINDKPLKPVEN